ncbi:unnamed protein product, partial [Iphiclides podalirius]
MSSNSIAQNSDDYKSLELCTTRNQQRLGSVFGNFTRHHKKGHRRRTTTSTTSTQTTIIYTTENIEETSEAYTTNAYVFSTQSTFLKLPKPLRLSSLMLDKDYTEDVHNFDNPLKKVVKDAVTWIRRKDYSLLSVGLVTYSADNRFFSAHGRHVKDWALHIRFATSADAGYYECQVPTHPPTSIFFKLILVAAYAEIVGESEKIIHEGSMLKLVCVVKRSTEPPSYVFWYFENRMINYDLNGVSVNNGRQTSELIIGKAEPRHAGNYTCVPANAKAASVTVHVVQSETPAAMQHGNSSVTKNHVHCFTSTMIALTAFILIIKELYQEFG